LKNDAKYKIVIIDDNNVSRSMLRQIILSETKHECVGQVGGGRLGLNMVGTLMPDIVLLDIMMEDISGLEVLASIKERWPLIIVVMISGNKDADTVNAAMKNGADGYLGKPFTPAALLTALEKAISKKN
jgi:DNA-binding NarL/FixJ family response regulator